MIGIVGPTGAGKSTLVSLLPRFYEPSSGTITLDGVDVRDVTLESLRAQVSLVLQDSLFFSGSIADNIRYGRLEASLGRGAGGGAAANAHDFITALPAGYDTEINEKGVGLSGGERRRIAVARAFLKDAPILILDEPTSSIDSRTEAVILDALDRLKDRAHDVHDRAPALHDPAPRSDPRDGRGAHRRAGGAAELLARGGLYTGSGRRNRLRAPRRTATARARSSR